MRLSFLCLCIPLTSILPLQSLSLSHHLSHVHRLSPLSVLHSYRSACLLTFSLNRLPIHPSILRNKFIIRRLIKRPRLLNSSSLSFNSFHVPALLKQLNPGGCDAYIPRTCVSTQLLPFPLIARCLLPEEQLLVDALLPLGIHTLMCSVFMPRLA